MKCSNIAITTLLCCLDIFMRMQELYPRGPGKIHPTTMYTETPRIQPVTETPLSLCDSMQLMLLQSWGNKIRVLPAVPESWGNISFDGLLAAGGFEISAVRKGGRTQFIRITSRAGEPCRLVTEMKPARIEGIDKSAVQRSPDGSIVLNLKQGQEVILFAQGVNRATIEAVEAAPEDCNTFGLN